MPSSSSADPSGPPAAGAPTSALDLVGAGAGAGAPTDADAARQALDAGELARQPDDLTDPSAGAPGSSGSGARADRRRRPGDRRPRKGGYKSTKEDLEREVKELRAQLETARPEIAATIDQQAAQLAPALAATFDIVFATIARARGAHWKLGAEEKQLLGSVWAPPMAPYMAGAGPAIPWAMAALATWGVVESRVELDHKQRLPLPAAA